MGKKGIYKMSESCLISSFQFILPGYSPDCWVNPEPEAIHPYEGGAVSNYPGGSNIFYIPSDVYYTVGALVESIKHGDNEEVIDASTRLFGIPANIVSTGGTIASYGSAFGWIAHLPWYLTPITIIAGLLLCIVEGIVDIISLARQAFFEEKFDLEILSHLRNIVSDIEPKKTMDAIKALTKLVNEDPESLTKLLGADQAEIVKGLMNEIQEKVQEHPELLPTIINHYRPALQEVAKQFLIENLENIKSEFLQLSEYEEETIRAEVRENNPDMNQEELSALETKELEIASTIKKKKFARRVRPWMVQEANETINPLLRGIVKGDPEAIKEGLRLADDIHIQSKKKKLAHILGIIALVFAAASLIAMAFVCPATIPFILAGVAMSFALVRAGVFSGMLESRGWTFEPKKLLPESIRKRVFSNPGAVTPEITHNYQKSLIPLRDREIIELRYTKIMDLQKRGFELQAQNVQSRGPVSVLLPQRRLYV